MKSSVADEFFHVSNHAFIHGVNTDWFIHTDLPYSLL